MAYLGNDLQVAYPSYLVIDDISSQFNGSLKTFALRVAGSVPVPFPINPQQCLISVNNIVQKPDSTGTSGFTLTGSNIVFAAAPTAGWSFFGTVLAGADYVNVGANFPSGTAAVPSVTFDQSTGTGLFLVSSNVLGIATSGIQQLTVDSSGNVNVGGVVSSARGTVAAPAYRFTDDSNTGIYSPGADTLAFVEGGVEAMRIDSSGRVGIGTTTPGAPVDVIAASDSIAYRVRGRSSDSASEIQFTDNGATASWAGLRVPAANTLAINTANTERARIDSSGRVGIGTTSPLATCVISDGGANGVEISPSVSSSTISQITSYNRTSNAYSNFNFDAATTRFSISGSEKARIDSSGRLLVGTSSGRTVGNTAGSIQIEGVTDTALTITNNGNGSAGDSTWLTLARTRGTAVGGTTIVNSGDWLGNLDFAGHNGSSFNVAARISGQVDGTPGANDMPGRLVFYTTADGASTPTERMRIDSSGAIGIGGANYGTSGQAFTSNGIGAAPSWQTIITNSISQGNSSATITDTGSNGTFTVVTEGGTALRVDSSKTIFGPSLSATQLSYYSVASGGNNTAMPGNYVCGDAGNYPGGPLLWSFGNTTNNSTCELTFLRTKSNNSVSFSGATTINNAIGYINFLGSDGTSTRPCASIQSFTEAAVTSTSSPGRIVFGTTTPGAVTISEKMRIDGNGFTSFTGSIGRGTPVTKTGNFTVAIAENWIICNGTATITVTLPTASSWTGREIMIKTIAAFTVVSASSNVVPLVGGAAATAILSAVAGRHVTLVSDGTSWVIMQGNP
jgi:hypothetical protein